MKNLKIYLLFFSFLLIGCGHPLDYFYNEIKNYGYHSYLTPLEEAGTGTLISGTPKSMDLVAHPETCFPYENNSIRYRDNSTLPSHTESFTIDFKMKAEFLKALSNSSPSIRASIRTKEVHTIDFKMEGIHIEYFDSIKLVEFYKDSLSQLCKQYLENDIGFITQVIKVDKLEFSFFRKNRGKIFIDLENIKEYLDFSTDVSWDIEEGVKLVITTPKYIGYQLAKIKKKKNKITLYRSNSTGLESWSFYKVVTVDLDKEFDQNLFKYYDLDG